MEGGRPAWRKEMAWVVVEKGVRVEEGEREREAKNERRERNRTKEVEREPLELRGGKFLEDRAAGLEPLTSN